MPVFDIGFVVFLQHDYDLKHQNSKLNSYERD